MARRLQVLLEDEEFEEIRRIAHRRRMSMSEWVRQALRQARRDSHAAIESKLVAITTATRHQGPTADIDQMLKEIDAGRGLP